jgi:dGTPase
MEAADSICYLVMDIEDGFNKGWYSFDYVISELNHIDFIREAASYIEANNVGIREEVTRMVKLRISLIQYLVDLAAMNFLENYDQIIEGKYNKELIFHDEAGLAKALQEFCFNNIFPSREITSLELTGHSVITGLLNIYIDFVFNEKPEYRNRASGLISDSIISIALEENKDTIIESRIKEFESEFSSELDSNKKEGIQNKIRDIKQSLDELSSIQSKMGDLITTNKDGSRKEEIQGLEKDIKILELKVHEMVNPTLDDLNVYYKLRVIVDYISGMTDQFALSQYQMLSGQKII